MLFQKNNKTIKLLASFKLCQELYAHVMLCGHCICHPQKKTRHSQDLERGVWYYSFIENVHLRCDWCFFYTNPNQAIKLLKYIGFSTKPFQIGLSFTSQI